MTTWVAKIKRILDGFLASQDNKYITTEDGLIIQILDIGKFTGKTKATTVWGSVSKVVTAWADKTKSS